MGSITGGPLSALLWAMYADTADYAEWKKGRRATGLVFSASIFSQKQGWAIGAAVALGLMSAVGFHANVAQTAETLHGLRLLFGLIPAAIGLVSVVILLFYPLNETRMKQIGEELKARRADFTHCSLSATRYSPQYVSTSERQVSVRRRRAAVCGRSNATVTVFRSPG